MKKPTYTLTVIFLLSILFTNAQNYRWAHGFGTPNGDSQGTSIATDANGNVYVAGTHADTIDFDPGLDTANIAPGGFIAKYDSTGLFQWAIRTAYNSYGTLSIAVNATGVYATGCFNGTFDFDPSPAVVNLTANWADIFLAKYDLNGNYLWAKNMGGANVNASKSIALDNYGNCYITGFFRDSTDFNPDLGINSLISNGNADAFFAKYDSNGTYVWAHSVGDTSYASGTTIALNKTENVFYVGGYFNGSPDFDPGIGSTIVTSSNVDDFLAKYDTSGNFIWAGAISSSFTGGNLISEIQVYTNPNFSTEYLIVTGSFRNITDFDLTTGINNFSSAGTSQDLYVAMYDQSGNFISLRTLTAGTSSGPRGISFQIDSVGSIYLTGTYYGTTDFDPASNLVNLSSNGNSDIFFAKYDSSGAYLWVKGIGGTYMDQPSKIALDKANNQYLTGFFTGSMDADPGSGVATLFPATGENIFIAKYDNSLTNIHSFSSQNNSSNLLVYPNPASSYITLGANLPFQKFNYSICDLSGRMVLTRKDAMNKTLNISMLSPGAYIINIQTTKQNLYGEFIKLL